MKMKICAVCQKSQNCDVMCQSQKKKGWFYPDGCDFKPIDEVKKFFKRGYIGNNKYAYIFDPTHKDLVPTKEFVIGSYHICPYCGNMMFCIQDPITLKEIGYTCFCEGAKAEREYIKARYELQIKHGNEVVDLKKQFKDKLTFDVKTLISIHRELQDKSLTDLNDNCFTYINSHDVDFAELLKRL